MQFANEIRVRGDYFSECIAALHYTGSVREAILRYKFHGAQAYAHAFGKLLAERIGSEFQGQFDILSWVPLSRDRRRRRGYDQAGLLARHAALQLGYTVEPVLKKRHGVKPQSVSGDKTRRRANIADAYSVIDAGRVTGKRILLVDDIVTTGSTMSECARTLLLAGAEDVMGAALAVAGE